MNKAHSLEEANRAAIVNDIATAKAVGSVAKQLSPSQAREAMVHAIATYMHADGMHQGYMISPTMHQVNSLLSQEPLHNDVAQALRSMQGLA